MLLFTNIVGGVHITLFFLLIFFVFLLIFHPTYNIFILHYTIYVYVCYYDVSLFVRHANANAIVGSNRSDAPHDWKFRDQTRTLSPKGVCSIVCFWNYQHTLNIHEPIHRDQLRTLSPESMYT